MLRVETTLLPYRSAGNRLHWKLIENEHQFVLTPRSAVPEILLTWIAGMAICGFGVWFTAYINHSPSRIYTPWTIFFVVMLSITSVLTYSIYRDCPRLILDRRDGSVSSPLLGLTWQRDAVLGWQILTESRTRENPLTQLVLLTGETPDGVARHLLFSGIGKKMALKTTMLIDELRRVTGIELVSHVVDGVEKAAS